MTYSYSESFIYKALINHEQVMPSNISIALNLEFLKPETRNTLHEQLAKGLDLYKKKLVNLKIEFDIAEHKQNFIFDTASHNLFEINKAFDNCIIINRKIESCKKELNILKSMMQVENCTLSCLALTTIVNNEHQIQISKRLASSIPQHKLNIANQIAYIQKNLHNYKRQFRILECKRIKVLIYYFCL